MPAPSARHIEPLLTLSASVPLAGTIAATSSLTGSLTVTAPAAGTIAATSTLTGALTSKAALTGTVAATSTLTGALTLSGVNALAGTITTHSTLTGDLSVEAEIALAGTIASTTSLTGTLANTVPPLPPHVPGLRYAIHWFWEPGRYSEQPDPPKTCPACGAPVVVMSLDAEVYCRHYEADATTADGTITEADCPYIATINDSNYAQPLPADIAAGYVLTAPVA